MAKKKRPFKRIISKAEIERLVQDGGSNGTNNLQEKTVTENGVVTPDSGFNGLSKVTVNVSGASEYPNLKIVERTAELYNNGNYKLYEDGEPFDSFPVLLDGVLYSAFDTIFW